MDSYIYITIHTECIVKLPKFSNLTDNNVLVGALMALSTNTHILCVLYIERFALCL